MGSGQSTPKKPQPPQSQPTKPTQQPQVKVAEPAAKVEIVEVTQNEVKAEPQQLSVKDSLEIIGEYMLSLSCPVTKLKNTLQNSETYKSCTQTKAMLWSEVGEPLCRGYTRLPAEITKAKMQTISRYTYNERFAMVNGVAVVAALITFRRVHAVQLLGSSLRAFRNVGITYLISGVMIAPQMYNPLMRDR